MRIVPKPNRPAKHVSITREIRSLVVLNPTITSYALKQKLIAKGWKEAQIKSSTLNTIKTDTGVTIQIAQEKGLWKDKPGMTIHRKSA